MDCLQKRWFPLMNLKTADFSLNVKYAIKLWMWMHMLNNTGRNLGCVLREWGVGGAQLQLQSDFSWVLSWFIIMGYHWNAVCRHIQNKRTECWCLSQRQAVNQCSCSLGDTGGAQMLHAECPTSSPWYCHLKDCSQWGSAETLENSCWEQKGQN